MRFLGILFLTLICSFAAFAQTNKSLAQNFSAMSMNGEMVELNSLKGKVVILTFWSTRCQICHNEIPKLNRLAAQYKGKDVVFLGLTMENAAKVDAYLTNNPFNFEILPNSFGVVLKYADKDSKGNINMGFPAHYVVNQRGEIELRTSGFDKTETLNAQIARLLGSR